jgi:hypothetical protein
LTRHKTSFLLGAGRGGSPVEYARPEMETGTGVGVNVGEGVKVGIGVSVGAGVDVAVDVGGTGVVAGVG